MRSVAELEVMVDHEIVNLVRELTYYDYAIVEDYEDRWNSLDVSYNDRLRSTLGRFWGSKEKGCFIEINPECPESKLRDTVRHEVLHLLTGLSDTKEFEMICNKLEIDFTHTVDLEKAEDWKYKLICEDCGSVVAKRKRKCKLTKHTDHYHSGCCGADLILKRI